MDSYDASKMILTRIQSLDPENASKIMGYILIQDMGDKELIRLAHGPETHLVSLINQAKCFFRISTNMRSTNHNGSHFLHVNSPKSPVLSSSPSSPWSNTSNGFSAFSRKSSVMASYAQSNASIAKEMACGSSSSLLPLGSDGFHGDFNDEYINHAPMMSPSGRSDSVLWNYEDHSSPHHNPFHRRSCSVNDAHLFEENDGAGQNGNLLGGWRPCMYYSRGFCKNGNSCKFSHTFDESAADLPLVGSPNNMDGFDYLRMKSIQQKRFAAASELMASGPRHSFPHKRSSAAALMGEDFPKLGPYGPDMNTFSGMGLNCISQQIYLTFPADSAFTEEDVSNYFSMYGPVQDVRIPYQQKRMFGFVTFLYPETVNLILAKGNPHFVCDSRVLVKPYKEKGKVAEKKRQQLLFDRGEFPACLSPTGLDAREPYDRPFAGGTFYNSKVILKNKLEEQAELKHAIELQGRRLMNMHLMEQKNNYNNHQSCPGFPPAFPLACRRQSHPEMYQNDVQPFDLVDIEVQEVNLTGLGTGDTPADFANEKDNKELSGASDDNNGCEDGILEAKMMLKDADSNESLEHILPDKFFTSPTETFTELRSVPERIPTETGANIVTVLTSSNYEAVLSSTSTILSAAESAKSCHFQMPRFLSQQGVVEM